MSKKKWYYLQIGKRNGKHIYTFCVIQGIRAMNNTFFQYRKSLVWNAFFYYFFTIMQIKFL